MTDTSAELTLTQIRESALSMPNRIEEYDLWATVALARIAALQAESVGLRVAMDLAANADDFDSAVWYLNAALQTPETQDKGGE